MSVLFGCGLGRRSQELLDLGMKRGLAVAVFLRGTVDDFGAGFAEQVSQSARALTVDVNTQ